MASGNKNFHFVGRHVDIIREACIASAVSGKHLCLVGPPGCGKTAMALEVAKEMCEPVDEKYLMTRIDPSTPVEVVEGMADPAKLLDPEKPRYVIITDGTPYEDGVRIWIPDELYRGSDPLFDKMLQTLDMGGKARINGDYPVAWGTTNFITVGDRLEAFTERIAMIVYLNPGRRDVSEVVRVNLMSGGRPTMPGTIPTWDAIQKVRDYKPTPKALKAVQAAIKDLDIVATREGRGPNDRRIDQWAEILYRYSAYLHGVEDFDTIPVAARKMLRHAYPATSVDESQAWKQIVDSVVDKVGAAIDRVMAKAVVEFRNVAVIDDQHERTARVAGLGKVLAGSQGTLKQLGDDPRIAASMRTLTSWFAAASLGETEVISYEDSESQS